MMSLRLYHLQRALSYLRINLISLSHGCASGWVSPALHYLKSEDSHLKQAITVEEATWIASSLPIGGFIGTLAFGYLAQRLSKKTSLMLVALPNMGFWILVYFSTDVTHLYYARVLAGLATGGVFITISLFVADISENHIRGAFGSFMVVSVNLGVVSSFIAGAFLQFFTIPIVMIVIPCMFIILVQFYLPDTPHSLLKHHKIKEARESFMFYRSCKSNKEIPSRIQIEFDALKKSFETTANQESEQKLSLSDFKSKIAIRGLLLSIFLMFLSQFSGSFAIMNYASAIFQASGSSFSPNVSSIFVAVVQLLGACASVLLVEKYGRKILLIISSLGTSFGLSTMAVYSFLDEQGVDVTVYSWVPIFSLSTVVFMASVGILSLPFIVLTEILPKKIRSFASPVCMSSVTISAFAALMIFPFLIETIELYGCMLVFAAVCMASAFILMIFLPETKGKNLVNE